jgi:hypothetical protein
VNQVIPLARHEFNGNHHGLHLADDVFLHGQLYIAFSRAKALVNVKVQLPDTMHGRISLPRNVVYEEALL